MPIRVQCGIGTKTHGCSYACYAVMHAHGCSYACGTFLSFSHIWPLFFVLAWKKNTIAGKKRHLQENNTYAVCWAVSNISCFCLHIVSLMCPLPSFKAFRKLANLLWFHCTLRLIFYRWQFLLIQCCQHVVLSLSFITPPIITKWSFIFTCSSTSAAWNGIAL